ncbi:MAG: ATP-binding protein [Gemmatimonadota bacterium]
MTFQRKLLLGFCLMILPALLVGGVAIRSNLLERRALDALGSSLSRTRTYAELETAMFDQSEAVWRYLSGMDPGAKREFSVSGEVADYWQQRWASELNAGEIELADGVKEIHQQIQATGDSIFVLYDAGKRDDAYRLAQRELKGRLLPALTEVNHVIYRRARESSVRGAYTGLGEILSAEGRILVVIIALALIAGSLASWLIARSLARPISRLTQAMGAVGGGNLDPQIPAGPRDEIGDLALAFARMTESLRESRVDLVRLNAELQAKVGQVERTQAQLVQSERLASIGEMSAAVAHGLRNPLASLRAAAQLALRHPESPASREQLLAIIEEVDRLDRRVGHLLSFSRPAPFHPLRESVAQLVDGLLPTFAERLRERRVELRVEIPADLPEVRVDPMQVEQSLIEIMSNAIDAMPNGGHLRISARYSEESAATRENGGDQYGPGEVAVELTDTGGGIPEQVLPSVCDPFFTTRPEGTGLGLATAKRYIMQNGGRLAIESRVGHGTTVRLWLPVAAPEPALIPGGTRTA